MFNRQEIWTSIGLDFFVNIEVIAFWLCFVIIRKILSFIKMKSVRRRHPELAPASPHKLRHTGATLAKQAGVSLEAFSEALTHSDKEITKTYVNIKDKVNQTVGDIAFRSLKNWWGEYGVNFGVNFDFLKQKRHPRNNSWMSVNVDIIVLINVLSAAVAIQSNIASLVFLGQLCIAYLYATKVARAILIAHRQFS